MGHYVCLLCSLTKSQMHSMRSSLAVLGVFDVGKKQGKNFSRHVKYEAPQQGLHITLHGRLGSVVITSRGSVCGSVWVQSTSPKTYRKICAQAYKIWNL